MGRQIVYSYDLNEYDEPNCVQVGWFDTNGAEIFEDYVTQLPGGTGSAATRATGEWQDLYRTKGGRWVLCERTQWQGKQDRWSFIDDEKAREWLMRMDYDEAVEKYWPDLEDERGPGRPEIGPMVNVRLGDELTARVDAARGDGESRAAAIRRLLDAALS